MAQQFPYRFRDPDQELVMDQPAVYKLHFGNKYFIWKGKMLRGSLEQNFADIDKMYWRVVNPAHAFAPVISYIKKNSIRKCEVEVIIQTDDPRLLIKAEADALITGRDDQACLNAIFEPHIPKWLAEVMDQVPAAPLIGPVPGAAPVKRPAANKARKTTLDKPDDKVPIPKPVESAMAMKTAPGKLNKLQQAFSKLKK